MNHPRSTRPDPRSRRRIPLRAKVVDALDQLPLREGILFPSTEGARIELHNFRIREWTPALKAAGVEHRRIYDMRHTFATWGLAAGVSIFTLARRLGTSVQMIDQTYGHLAPDADDHDPEAFEAFDNGPRNGNGHVVGTSEGESAETPDGEAGVNMPGFQGLSASGR